MSEFEGLLTKYMQYRAGVVEASAFTKQERADLWKFINNYILGLSKKQFKQQNYLSKAIEREVTPHDTRVMAFYDFVDYAVKRDVGARWVLSVFKMRFVDLEGLLTMKRRGAVNVDEMLKNGISTSWARRFTVLSAARRACYKLHRHQINSFEGLLPCISGRTATTKSINNWKSYHNMFEYIRKLSYPLPLLDAAINEEEVYEDD